jgi:hypothetical protein
MGNPSYNYWRTGPLEFVRQTHIYRVQLLLEYPNESHQKSRIIFLCKIVMNLFTIGRDVFEANIFRWSSSS